MKKNRIYIQGEGNIVEIKKNKTYRIRFRLPPINGKRKWSPSITIHGDRTQARIALEQYRKDLENELNNEFSGLTIFDYASEFHARRKAMRNLSPLTLERDQIEIDRIKCYFGRYLVQDLGTREIYQGYAKLREDGLSANAIHKVHQKLKQILKQAVKEEIIDRNPCDKIDDIKRPEPKERRSLTDEQAIKLAHDLKTEERNGCIVAVWLALATGIRRGEALGLVWGKIDFKKKSIRINKQLDKNKTLRDPKSKKSIRTLSIDDGTVAFLKEWKTLQSLKFLDGCEQDEDYPVCTSEHGDFISPYHFDKWRRSFFVKEGLGKFNTVAISKDKKGQTRTHYKDYDGFNFHELRHTQATLLIGSGADIKTVQQRLGHASASLTMDIYAHAIEEKDREAANLIGDILNDSKY